MRMWSRIAKDYRLIATLVILLFVQSIYICGLLVDGYHIPEHFRVDLPPDISNGVSLKVNQVSKSSVGAFAFYVWQVINNWQDNGLKDSSTQLTKYRYYLSPQFRYDLKNLYKKLSDKGQLQGRIRVVRPMPNQEPKVTKISSTAWQVILFVRVSEYVNGILVKDKEIEYPIKVEKFNQNAQFNPYGLVLAGFTNNPKILKVIK